MSWETMRIRVFRRDGFTCGYCGVHPERLQVVQGGRKVATLHADHMYPLSLGGENNEENLVTACPECNCSKGIEIWAPPIARCRECRAYFKHPDVAWMDPDGPKFTCLACVLETKEREDPNWYETEIELEIAQWDSLAEAVGL